jgi:hypothetical protein
LRVFLLVLLGLFLLTLEGVVVRFLHWEIVRIDISLLLTVFVALEFDSMEGSILAFLLGVVQDSFAATVPGLLTTVNLVLWIFVRWARRFLLSGQTSVRLGLVFGSSLISGLLVIGLLDFAQADSGFLWLPLKMLVPQALLQMAMAVPVWWLVKRVLGPFLPRHPVRMIHAG